MKTKYVIEDRYMSTYDFVSKNGMEKIAEKTFGKNWEAEDDINQIQTLCDLVSNNQYVVELLDEIKSDVDIQVREADNWYKLSKAVSSLQIALEINKSNLMQLDWFNDFVDFVKEYDDNIYNKAREWADNQEAKKE